MSQALATSLATTASFLECGPAALWHWCSSRGALPTHAPGIARFCLDYITGAFLVAGATEVLVPADMVHWMEGGSAGGARDEWEVLAQDHRLVVLASCGEIEGILGRYPSYNTFCVPVPGGPFSSKLLFKHPIDAYYGVSVQKLTDIFKNASASSPASWRAWMRSGLTCQFEGHYVPPIRISDQAATLLGAAGGCTQIILEEASAGLTPRWLETILKTTSSCGIPPSCLSLALCDAPHTPKLIGKALEVGVCHLCTSSLGQRFGLFEKSHGLVALDTASVLVAHFAETMHADLSSAELNLLRDSATFVGAARKQWRKEVETCSR